MNTCADCGGRCAERCRLCRRAADRAELAALPIPQHNPNRTDEERAEAAARVAELREAGDVRRLSEAARRFLDRRGRP